MQMMQEITYEMYKTRVPNNTSVNMYLMTDKEINEFLDLYAYYMDLFYQYLFKKTNIQKHDKYLKEKNFIKVDDSHKDFYQYMARNYLDYFYVRNNLYLEKLTENERGFLKFKMDNLCKLDKDLERFIERTYSDVMYENVDLGEEKSVDIYYGKEKSTNLAPNNALVLGVRFVGKNKEMEEIIQQVIENVEGDIYSYLLKDVWVINYDETTI